MSSETPSPIVETALKPFNYVGSMASTIPSKYRDHIRNKAIDRARTRIIVAGNDPKKMSEEDLEIVVREEEDKIKSWIKQRGLLAVLALLGLNIFG